MDMQDVVIASISVPKRLRAVDAAKVKSIAGSISQVGLLSPIILYSPDEHTLDLVAGAHRLEAIKSLDWSTVTASLIEDESSLYAQLVEIDENLMRSELTATEYAEHMQRRKEVWEALQEQKRGGTTCSTRSVNGQFAEGNDGGGEGFAESTAKATGKTKQDTNRATKRAREVCQQARDIIRGTKADTGVFLDYLSKLDGDQAQVEAATDKVDAINDEQRRRDLREEQKEREQAAKERREQARAEFVNLLFENLTQQQWAQALRLLDESGGSIRVSTFRDWESA